MKISCCEISGISNEGIRNQFNSKVEFCSFLHFQPSTCSLHIFLLPHRGRYQARWILKCSQQNESPNSKWDKKIQWNAKCTESWCLGYNYTRLGILSNEWMKTFHISIFGLFLIALSFRKNEHRKKIQVFCNALEHEWIRTKVIPPWRELPNFWPFFKTDIGVSHCFDGFVISYCYVICFVFLISKR